MIIVKEGDQYIARCSFAEKDLPKLAGFRWDPSTKRWWTKISQVASKLAAYADATCCDELTAVATTHQAALDSSRAADAAVEIPVPTGLAYLPFQRAGIHYAVTRLHADNRAVLIADDCGLGKTIQAIGVYNVMPSIKRVLVVCPASLKINWLREWTKWYVRGDAPAIANGSFPVADVVIINYDVLAKHHNAIRQTPWDLLIVDESHLIKNPKAIRTKQVVGYEVFDKATKTTQTEVHPIPSRHCLFLTGTPIVNRPVEMWPMLHYSDPTAWSNFFRYAVRYCGAVQNRYGWDFGGASHLDELQERLRSTMMVRRLKSDVMTELPAKRRQIIEIPANGAQGSVAAENEAYGIYEQQEEALECLLEMKPTVDPQQYADAVTKLKADIQTSFTEMSRLRHDTAVATVPYAIDHIQNFIDAGEKVVIFAHHHDVIDALHSAFPNGAVVDGRVPVGLKRQAEVDRFQNNPNCMEFIGEIQAAGVGLTLTAASIIVFVELDWVPGNITQAEDRIHRIGQTNSVLIQHLVLEGSISVNMIRTLVSKQEVITEGLDANNQQRFETPGELAARIASTAVPVRSAAVHAPTSTISAKPTIQDPDHIVTVMRALRTVAGVCDGAHAKDNVGFNGCDTAFGRALAAQPTLTPRQAFVAAKMLIKYRRQIGDETIELLKLMVDLTSVQKSV